MVKNTKNCIYCQKLFELSRNDDKQIYCSSFCRTKHWQIKNPKKVKEHSQKAWKKHKIENPKYCLICGIIIPIDRRTSGSTRYCSNDCRYSNMLKTSRVKCKEKIHIFHSFKKERGCLICGYNKFGGALDFHHIDPGEKERRVTHKTYTTTKGMEEISKCILLCKNCHYEIHDLMRKDINEYLTLIKKKGY